MGAHHTISWPGPSGPLQGDIPGLATDVRSTVSLPPGESGEATTWEPDGWRPSATA